MLSIENLNKTYGQYKAVSDLNLEINEGELFGFVGPNGAGKTTTIRIVCGLLRANSGKIIIDGVDCSKNRELIKPLIGYVPDFFGVYDNLKVKEYMEFYGSMYGMTSRDMERITGDLLELVNLSDKQEAYVDTLSRGMKQRLCVARALIHNPKLLLLDEPNSGLDPRARVEMKELLMNLQSMGKTILISSHILAELSEMCSSIGIMDRGKLLVSGSIEEVTESFGANDGTVTVKIISGMDQAVRMVMESTDAVLKSQRENELIFTYKKSDEELSTFMCHLMLGGVTVGGFGKEQGSLESIFMQITGKGGENNES